MASSSRAVFQFLFGPAQLVQELLVLAFELEALAGFAQHLNQFIDPPGLEKIAVDLAAIDGFDGVFQLRKAGHEQANRLRVILTNPFQELNAAHARHFLVGEDEVDAMLLEDLLRSLTAIGGVDLEIRSQERGQGGQDIRLVIDHQKRAFVVCAHAKGRQRRRDRLVVKSALRPLFLL